ncbi:hypothetical protein [Cysteiniphilum marinum]|nr:hypothetical protein [Cysteiniphilum marinum]
MLYSAIEKCFAWVNYYGKKESASYCELESADDEFTLIAKDGSLLSILEFDGVNHLVGHDEYSYLSEQLTMVLAPFLQKQGITIKCVFRHDVAGVYEYVNDLLLGSEKTSQRIKLNFSDLYAHKKRKLEQTCALEKCYLCIWTSPSVLSSQETKNAYKKKAQKFSSHILKVSAKTQHFLHVIDEVRTQHQSSISILIESFNALGLRIEKLALSEALPVIKNQISYQSNAGKWCAALPGDKLYPIADTTDWSTWLWPSLAYQLYSDEAKNNNMSDCVIGNHRYASVTISLFPQVVQSFDKLFLQLKEYDMPWQACFCLMANGVKITQAKSLLARFLTFTSHENRLICNAHELLKNISENTDIPILKFSINFITWSHKDDTIGFQRQKSALTKAVQSWGGAQTTSNFGDPFNILQSSLVGVNKRSLPCAVAAPLSDAVKLMPFFQPATSWQTGATLFCTSNGKLWPYQSGSSQQISWIELIYARSGAGKSVLLNALNLSACVKSGLEELPYLVVFDIGPSSKGLIDYVQEASGDKDVAEHHYFTFSHKDAINPFDTYLGARIPSQSHRNYLVNLLSVLLLEDMSKSLPEGFDALLKMVIEETYIQHDDQHQPKSYQRGLVPEVDKLVENHELISWWQVVDYLFDQGHIDLAKVAQRYAMPILSDLITAVNHVSIADLYRDISLANGENYIQYFCRNITSMIKSFPSLNMVSNLEVKAKVAAFDLSAVMSGVLATEVRTSVVAYMLVRHVTASYFYLNAADLESIAQIYQSYHQSQIKNILTIPKRVVFDEFHRMQGCEPIMRQVLTDMREGRKHSIQITLASQSLSDFNPVMLEFATSVFILSGGNQSSIEKTKSHFGLNDTETSALKTSVHGPSSRGMNFIGQFHTKNGVNTQLLNLTLSAYEIWVFTTTSEDCYLKQRLIECIGVSSTLSILAAHFPTGSAKPYLESQTNIYKDQSAKAITEKLVNEMVENFYKDGYQNDKEI